MKALVYSDGLEIREFTPDHEAYKDWLRRKIWESLNLVQETRIFGGNLNIDTFGYVKIIGIFDFICTHCPNKRVVHLAKYGKSHRVQVKNFYRALVILVAHAYEFKVKEK